MTTTADHSSSRPPDVSGEELAAGPLFRTLQPAERAAVLAAGRVHTVAAGESIVRQGDVDDEVHVLLRGSAEVVVRGPDGEVMEVGSLTPGDTFGEIGALLHEPRTAGVVADEPSILLSLSEAELIALMGEIPHFGLALARDLARDLEQALGTVNEHVVTGAPETVELDPAAASGRGFLRRRTLRSIARVLRRGRLRTAESYPSFTAKLRVDETDLERWSQVFHRRDSDVDARLTVYAPTRVALLQRALVELGAEPDQVALRRTRLTWGPAPLTPGEVHDLQLDIDALIPTGPSTVALVTQTRLRAGDGRMVLTVDDLLAIDGVDGDTIRQLGDGAVRGHHQPFDTETLRACAGPLPAVDPAAATDASAPAGTLDAGDEVAAIGVPQDFGTRFGRLTGDMDPLHTSRAAARQRGHHQPFLHPLATLNIVLAAVTDAREAPPDRLELTFTAPVYLGDTVAVRLRGDRVEVVDAEDVLQAHGRLGTGEQTSRAPAEPSRPEGAAAVTEATIITRAASLATADLAMAEVTDAAPGFPEDALALRRYLDRRHHDVRDHVREVISRPDLRPEPAVTTDSTAYRDAVLGWLRTLAAEDLTAAAMPVDLGGRGDPSIAMAIFETLAFGDLSLLVKYGVQVGLWGGAVLNLGTRRHHERWLRATADLDLPGCFALTELGHGSDARSIRTTITYDPADDSLVVHTPDVSARKEYIGNAARHGRIAAVFGQLEVDGADHGVHAVVVPLRSDDGQPLDGVDIGDCGLKLGLNGVDNGRLSFDQVRVPRDNLLDAYGTIAVDGRYSSPIESRAARFFTMLATLVQGRISVALGGNSAAKTALAIAIRYADHRRQFGPGPDEPETLLLDYLTHQRRLLPALATSYALDAALQDLVDAHMASRAAPEDEERRMKVEAQAAALKALATWHATETIQECREACGGAGYIAANRFAALKADTDVFTTFEGDNTVLLQLVTKTLLSGYRQQFEDPDLGVLVRYALGRLAQIVPSPPSRTTDAAHLRSHEFQLETMQAREELAVADLARRIKGALDDGLDPYAAFLKYQERVVAAGAYHGERLLLEAAVGAVERCEDDGLRGRLDLLRQLHGLSRLERDRAWFLEQGVIAPAKARAISREVNRLCAEIRPQAGWLVAALGIPEPLLADTIARPGAMR